MTLETYSLTRKQSAGESAHYLPMSTGCRSAFANLCARFCKQTFIPTLCNVVYRAEQMSDQLNCRTYLLLQATLYTQLHEDVCHLLQFFLAAKPREM